jgi:hypothetical protein
VDLFVVDEEVGWYISFRPVIQEFLLSAEFTLEFMLAAEFILFTLSLFLQEEFVPATPSFMLLVLFLATLLRPNLTKRDRLSPLSSIAWYLPASPTDSEN